MCATNESGVLMTDGEILKLIIDIKDEIKTDIDKFSDKIEKKIEKVSDKIENVQDVQIDHGKAIAVINKTLNNGINSEIKEIKERVGCIEKMPAEKSKQEKTWKIMLAAILASSILTATTIILNVTGVI